MQRLFVIAHTVWNILFQLFAFLLLYLTPISNYVHLVLVLIAFDFVTGSYASIKEGERFSARKLRNTLEKFVFYVFAIVIAYMLQRIMADGSQLPRIVALYIGSIEVKSNYENISRITKTDIVTALYNLIKTKIEGYIETVKIKSDTKDEQV